MPARTIREAHAANLRNKLSRGKFTAVFVLQCLEPVDAQKLDLV